MITNDEETEYRIEFTITRRLPEEDDFTEVGFGSSGAWSDLDACVYAVESSVCNGIWETEPGHPEVEQIVDDIKKVKEAQ